MSTKGVMSAPRWRVLGAVLAMLGMGVVLVAPVAAQGDASGAPALSIDEIDATGDDVAVFGTLANADPSSIELRVDGKAVEPTSAELLGGSAAPRETIAVVDNAGALPNATVQLAKDALVPLLPGAGATESLGVISTGGKAVVESGPTTSPTQATSAIESISLVGQSATWDGIIRAAELLEVRAPGTTGTVVVFAASPALLGGATPSAAASALQQAGVTLQVVAMGSAPVAALQSVVGDVGGSTRTVSNDEEIAGAFESLAAQLAGQFRLTFPAPEGEARVVDLVASSGDATTTVSFVPGATRVGDAALAPIVAPGSGAFGFLQNSFAKLLIVVLGVAAVVMLAWAIMSIVMPDENNLVRRLEAYEDPYGEEVPEDIFGPAEGHSTVPIIKRAVEFTGDIAERRGALSKLEARLERANLPLRAAEAMFFNGVITVLVLVLAFVLTGSIFMALVGAVVAVILPQALLNLRIRRRQKAFVQQLPDMLSLMAGTLRAGYSIGQGFESVSQEIADPMGRELRRVVTESRLGRPLEEALDSVAERMDSDDFGWAVMAIRIQREVGGNLAELLLTVSDTMTQRERLRRDVSTLTAEGRMSAIIIGLLPPGLAVVMWVMNPEYIKELFSPGLGYMLLGAAVVMMAIGFAWMKKCITIEV